MTKVVVRAVPTRLDCVERLRAALPDAVFLVDPNFADPSLPGGRKAMLNFMAALAEAGRGGCVHMEEDVLLCDGFRERLEAAVSERRRVVIQFFSSRSADLTTGSRWDRKFSMNQCFYLPPGYSSELLAFLPKWCAAHPEHPGGYDLAMDDWLRRRKEPHWIHCPSLVDHMPLPSVIDRRRSKGRQSKTFPGGPVVGGSS